MAKAVRQARPIIRGVKLSEPSPVEDRHAHFSIGFDYGLEFADRIISETIATGLECCRSHFVTSLFGLIRINNGNAFPMGIGSALVTIISGLNHCDIAKVRTAAAILRSASPGSRSRGEG
jgi:hypothetical protein